MVFLGTLWLEIYLFDSAKGVHQFVLLFLIKVAVFLCA